MKRKTIVLFSVLAIIFSLLLTGCGAGAPLEKTVKLLEDAEREVTVTDIRNDIPTLAEEYSTEEINDILVILNDRYNNQLGSVEYYMDVCEALPESDVEILYQLVSGTETNAETAKGEDDENNTGTEAGEETNIRPAFDFKLIIIIAGAIAGVLAVILIIFIIIKNSKKRGVKSERARNKPGQSSSYHDDNYYEDDDYETNYQNDGYDSGDSVNISNHNVGEESNDGEELYDDDYDDDYDE